MNVAPFPAQTGAYTPSAHLLGKSPSVKPESLDSVTFQYLGTTFHAYGVLHGLTGGTNRDYVKLVNKSIFEARGLKLGEKEMGKLYRGLDGELFDWVQMPNRDTFRAGFSLVCTPSRLFNVARCAFKELTTRRDKAIKQPYLRLQDLGGSAVFHAIHPLERRQLAGFIPPAAYLKENLARRRGDSRLTAPVFPDRDWVWLNYIEPYTNIAMRSVHMLHFAATLAKLRGVNEVSLFVGEIHNTDMQWFASSTLSEFDARDTQEIAEILREASGMANRVEGRRIPRIRQCLYLISGSAGVSIPLAAYAIAGRLLLEVVKHAF